ncbi:hypothetical protein ACP4OV_011563 [Aristida adscensionis]
MRQSSTGKELQPNMREPNTCGRPQINHTTPPIDRPRFAPSGISSYSPRFMEEIRRALEETREEVDRESRTTDRPAADQAEPEYGDEADEEAETEDDHGDDDEEEGDDDDDDNDDICSFIHCYIAVQKSTIEEARKVEDVVRTKSSELVDEWTEMYMSGVTPVPPSPRIALPEITTFCFPPRLCYHRRFWTDLVSPTEPNHQDFEPCEMMQVFSLRLSSARARPVNIHGHFAVRHSFEPLRNYIFKRSRDDPATIAPGCSSLPLCSPCRGIYVLQYNLFDFDLWIKEEDESADKQLISGFVLLDAFPLFGGKSRIRIHGSCGSLDTHFAFLSNSIESVVEIFAEAKHPSKVNISARTSGLDDEIALYDGMFCGTGTMVKHFLAVKLLGELQILLKLDESLYSWTYQAGTEVVKAPKCAVPEFAQVVMRVSFRTKGKAKSTWQWSCICNDVQLMEM